MEEPQSFDRVLSSMCTEPHPAARAAAERFLASNPGDPATFQTVADLETEVVETLGEVVDLSDPVGYVTSGGTEANLQAARIARERADGGARSGTPNLVVPDSAHFSFRKAADVLGLELRVAPVTDDGRADLTAVDHLVDGATAAVVGVAASTERGRVDPIPALADLASEVDALLHVDAAWGGFALPFTDHEWSFAHADVDTMTIDPHKLGRAAIPAGGLLARDRTLLDELAVDTPYLESREQATLTGTRSGAGVASAAAATRELWPDGYRRQHRRARANAEWLADRLRERGYRVDDPGVGVLAATVDAETFESLREAGWRVASTADGDLRVVFGPHVTRDVLESFVADLDRVGTPASANAST